MAIFLIFFGVIIVALFLDHEHKKNAAPKESVEDYAIRITAQEADKFLKRAEEIAAENGVDISES